MPELIEVELYRRAAEALVGATVERVVVGEPSFTRGDHPSVLESAVVGRRVESVGRHGKVMITRHGSGRGQGPTVVVGWRFGMTGRLVVAGDAPIDRLEYASDRDDPRWDRVSLVLDDHRVLRVNDPRRFGSVHLDPDLDDLGPDAASVSAAQLRAALVGSSMPLKAALLDQRRIAGLGNLLVDEILWRARLDPRLPAGTLTPAGSTTLARVIRSTIGVLTRRGGSHRGDLQEQRHRAGVCPRCGVPLRRLVVGGRTTYSCRAEQPWPDRLASTGPDCNDHLP